MSTRLFASDLTLPVAALGPENPLPPLHGRREPHHVENLADLPPDLRDNIRYGALPSVLPCLDQDGYDRNLTESTLPSLVLENEHLRATVLPGLGGRLYSLVHLRTGEELLYRNPVIQPANLALRNAWFAGGVEWNLGSTGHWTGTFAPMHAARVDGPDGSPVLRLWEWERSRGLVMQLDFWLPPGSEFLYVGARIQNPWPHDVPAYWWSNIAVGQTPGTRVLVPADQAWRFGYENRLDLVGVPAYDGFDLSYPMRHRRAVDFFFELPPGQRPWIAALNADGNGLVQSSTDRLRGRKLFVWGESRGGRRWQEWLSPGLAGPGYAEIQAGLARTQLEHLRLPAATSWHWMEAYGRLRADPAVAHAEDWATARAGVGDALNSLLPATELVAREAAWLLVADAPPIEPLATGSGWGALELARSGRRVSAGTPFGVSTMTDRERAWLPLLTGTLPATDPAIPPDGTLVGWLELLEAAAENWLVWYHRGVARWFAGDLEGATQAWRSSLRLAESPWALRNLAIAVQDQADESVELYCRATEVAPDVVPLLAEALDFLLDRFQSRQVAALIEGTAWRSDARIQLAEARVRLATGDAAGAEVLLDRGIELPGLREGRNHLAELWRDVQARLGTSRPVPAEYQFGMFGDGPAGAE